MKVNIRTIRTLSIIIFLSIILSGASIFSYVRIPRIFLCGLLGILGIYMIKNNKTFSLGVMKIWLLWILYLFFTAFISYDFNNTFIAALIYFSFFLLIFLNFNEKDMKLLITIIRVTCIIFSASILISVIIPNLFTEYFHFLITTDTGVIKTEIAEGIYSGMTGEKSNAAFYMNIGIALEIALYNKEEKFKNKNFVLIFIYLVSLMLTGKRTLLLVSLIVIAVGIKLLDIKGKAAKVFIYGFMIIPLIFIIFSFVPQVSVTIDRLLESSNYDTLNGRTRFWDFCIEMYEDKPLIGYGYDTFNEVFADKEHFIYNGKVWDMYAHNIYLELFGETGIVGFGIFCIALILLLIKSIAAFKNKYATNFQKVLLFFSIGIQVICILYGFTGNVIYAHYELGFYFAAILIYKTAILGLNNENRILTLKENKNG